MDMVIDELHELENVEDEISQLRDDAIKVRNLKWSQEWTHGELSVDSDYLLSNTNQGNSHYASSFAQPALPTSGVLYAELQVSGTYFWKLGVSANVTELGECFSDKGTGWSFYLYKLETRHNTSLYTNDALFNPEERIDIRANDGPEPKNTVGILIDRRLGNISFFLNGRSSTKHPIAFENLEEVKSAPNLHIAVSLTRRSKTWWEIVYQKNFWGDRKGMLWIGKRDNMLEKLPRQFIREIAEWL